LFFRAEQVDEKIRVCGGGGGPDEDQPDPAGYPHHDDYDTKPAQEMPPK